MHIIDTNTFVGFNTKEKLLGTFQSDLSATRVTL